MLTSFSLWAVYIASYFVDYILVLIILVSKRFLECKDTGNSFWKGADLVTWGILILLIALSIVITIWVYNLKMNRRVRHIPQKNITHQMTGYLVAQVATVATTLFTDSWLLINLILFLFFGIYFVRSKAVYTSPLFVIPLRNHIYQSGEKVIITNYSLQEMRIAQEDNENGLEARELTDGVFYIRKKL